MLGPVNLDGLWGYPGSADSKQLAAWPIHWVVVGAKTPGKPLHEQHGLEWNSELGPVDYLRSLRDQCEAAGVPFFYKHGGTNPELDGVIYDALR